MNRNGPAGAQANATRIWEIRPEPVPEGRPTIAQRFNAGWGRNGAQVPKGRLTRLHLNRPFGTKTSRTLVPALKRWASLDHPFGIPEFRIRLAALLFLSLVTPAVLVSGSPTAQPAGFAAPASALRFSPAGSNEFVFDTGLVRGKLRAGGKSMGLSSVNYVPGAVRVDSSMGLLSPYRVFSANKRYGTAAWDWPSQATLLPDGSVEVVWSPAPDRPFDLRAVYRLTTPTALDFEAAVRAKTDLRGFELFLASYFADGFTNSLVAAKPNGKERLLEAKWEDGVWQTFPRDDAAIAWLRDGRWKLEPNPVDWVVMPPLAKPLAVRRSHRNEVEAILMSPPGDCFAVSTPFSTEPHRSMYLSLFGRDLKAGEIARARARLVIQSSRVGKSPDELYQDYVRQVEPGQATKPR